MSDAFAGKSAVITGGASGIGAALGRALEAAGAQVLLADLAGEGTFPCDVADPAAVEALADEAWRRFGRVDLLVNNAGIGSGGKRMWEGELADARRVFEVNFWGVWNGCRAFIPRLIAQGGESAIFNVASENALFNAIRRGSAYIASKHAVLGLTESLRDDLPPEIHAGTIIPGWVGTEINPAEVKQHAMEVDRYARIVLPQLAARERFVVSHAYNAVRLRERPEALADAFARNAPRYPGDDEFDVKSFIAKLRKGG